MFVDYKPVCEVRISSWARIILAIKILSCTPYPCYTSTQCSTNSNI